ncbi:MAG: hypothetical protein DCE90_06755 [Pseudanabaena sp.]|nr:MAG: hypothetical protein DCE90_06755 [Pseudanabaena sp.]
MQTLSSPISPTISRKSKVADAEPDFLPAIAKSSALQTALAGLDASLNDELDRYRHWQDNGQTISYLNPFRPRAVSTQSIWTSPSLSEALYPAMISSSVEPQSDRRTIQMPVMPPIGAVDTGLVANISAAELHRYKGLEDLQKIENDLVDERSAYIQDMNGYGEDTLGSDRPNSPKMAQLPQPDDDDILQSFANDYAEQYQEAANQEFSSVPNIARERSPLHSLMNPVGIISLLLLLFSSAAIGYLMVDPSGVMKLFKPEATPKTTQEQSPEISPTAQLGSELNLQQGKNADEAVSFIPFTKDKSSSALTIEALIKDKPDSPNKADNQSLNPKSLSAIPAQRPSGLFAPRPSFVPSAPLRTVPSAALPPISVAPLAPAIAPIQRSYNPPPAPVQRSYEEPAPARSYSPPARRQEPVRVTRAAAPTSRPAAAPAAPTVAARSNPPQVKYAAPLTAAPAPASSAAPAASSYRVVVESSYAASAQQVEREAYIRPSDGQVQIGAYRDPNVAQQRIEELRRQGIPARIE